MATRDGTVTAGMGHDLYTTATESAARRHPEADRQGGPELSIVVPTFNEAENVPLVVTRIAEALAGVRWEVIFVDDDSPDGTAAAARKIAQSDPRVRCSAAHRPARAGRRLHRGHAGLVGFGGRRHGCGPAARRNAAAAHAREHSAGRGYRGRHALCGRRSRARRPLARAALGQPVRDAVRKALSRRPTQRPHERILHDAAGAVRRA